MAEEDVYEKISFYSGMDYGLDSEYGAQFEGANYGKNVTAGEFGITTDARTANQLGEVAAKLRTGAKNIEMCSVQPNIAEAIPKQHLDEINRLRKLAGVDLTFHGPILEASGITREGWSPATRLQVQRQMFDTVEKAHSVNPDGNVVVTFHSTANLPDFIQKSIVEVKDEKTGKIKEVEQIQDFVVADEAGGNFTRIKLTPDYFKGDTGEVGTIEEQYEKANSSLKEQNKENWYKQLQGVSYHTEIGSHAVEKAIQIGEKLEGDKLKELGKSYGEAYKAYQEGKADEIIKELKELGKPLANSLQQLSYGDTYLRDAYQDLQKLFNQAYATAKVNKSAEDLEKLDRFRKEMKEKIKDIEEPSKIADFAEEIGRGVNVLRSIKPPQVFKPMRDFVLDKSSETFANLAFESYEKFKGTSPIISIENPPAGGGLSRGADIKDLVEKSRIKLKEKLISKGGLSEGEAERQAEKLIGATWDVGHINMLRKYGYGEKGVVEETKTVAPYVKHIHLSDNFGMEHTELPMGMGNVPTKKMIELIGKYNDKVKKIIEAGDWYQHFKRSPFKDTLKAFGSPLYSMKMAPYWNTAANIYGGYFVGYGQMLPEQHFNIYGSGFSNLPPELGGQMGGRSRVSGTPMD